MKITILTEGGKNIGFGHVTRCLSIYQAAEDKGLTVNLVINGDDSLSGFKKNYKCEIFNWLSETKNTLENIINYDIVIIDSYKADIDFYRSVSRSVKLPVYIDDNRRLEYPPGIVINGNINAGKLNYPHSDGIAYLLGEKYIPLRKAFWNIEKMQARKNVKNIMITFGGDDMRNLTPNVLNLLCNKYPDFNKYVIVGKGFRNINSINDAADKRTNLIFNPDDTKMRETMFKCDFAISAGGQTLHELAAVGLPAIMLQVADNQANNIKFYELNRLAVFAGKYDDYYLFRNLAERIEGMLSYDKRSEFNKNCNRIDGSGALNIINFLINKVIDT